MFPVQRVSPPYGVTGLLPAGLSHSDICGSNLVCKSPQLFAAYHVLLRLQEPRHPPFALNYFLPVCTAFLLGTYPLSHPLIMSMNSVPLPLKRRQVENKEVEP